MEVGNPDASVTFDGQSGQIPCGTLQNMGEIGLIPPAQCDVLPQLVSTVCECQSINPTTTATVGPATTTTEATTTTTVSSKGDKSLSLKSKSSKAPKSSCSCSTRSLTHLFDTTASTSSEFNSEDLITLLRWIVYTSEAASPLPKEERAKQVDSLGTQTNQEGADEVKVLEGAQ